METLSKGIQVKGRQPSRRAIATSARIANPRVSEVDIAEALLRSVNTHTAVLDHAGRVLTATQDLLTRDGDATGTPLEHPCIGKMYTGACQMFSRLSRQDSADLLNRINAVVEGKGPGFASEYSYQAPGGRRWVLVSVRMVDRGDVGMVVTHEDITDQKRTRALDELKHRMNSHILHNRPIQSILTPVCAGIAELFDAPLVYITLIAEDGSARLRASAGPAEALLEGLDGPQWADAPWNKSRASHSCFIDLTEEPTLDPWMSRAQSFRIISFLSIPLVSQQRMVGALSLFSKRPTAMDDGMAALLTPFAEHLSISIGVAQQQAQLHLQTTALQAAANAIVITDSDGTIRWVNPAFARLTGYSREEAVGRRTSMLKSGRHDQVFYQGLWEAVLAGRIWRGEMQNRRKDGSLYTEEQTITPVRQDDGAITHFVAIKQDITDRIRQQEQIQHLARHDLLTDLPNRQVLQENLEQAVDRARHGRPSALLLLDVDDFKVVNEAGGHAAGDQVLVSLAHLLSTHLRPEDVLTRTGGDEFGVVVTDVTAQEARIVAERLRKAADGFHFLAGDCSCDPSISLGVAPINGELALPEIMNLAVRALYTAKHLGKNRVVLLEPSDEHDPDLVHAGVWLPRIREALRNGRFRLHFQQVVRLATDQPEYWEVLVRLLDAREAVTPPAVFIPAAERFGLMPQVDRYVVEQILPMLKDSPSLRLFVNLSGTSLGDDSLLTFIEERLHECPLAPGQLVFEITETAAVRDMDRAQHWMERLKRLGCLFALDDFGAGLSSFYHLRRLPVDYVKIDGSFVRNLDSDPACRAIVQALAAVAHSLDKVVVAEWVESEAVALLLAGLGVEFGQGYYWGQPAPEIGHLRSPHP